MSVNQEVKVVISAETAKFQTALADVQNRMAQFQRSYSGGVMRPDSGRGGVMPAGAGGARGGLAPMAWFQAEQAGLVRAAKMTGGAGGTMDLSMLKELADYEKRAVAAVNERQRKTLGQLLRSNPVTGTEAKTAFGFEGFARVGLVASAAINGLNIGSKVLGGNLKDAVEAVKQLPFGIGQMAAALEGVIGLWSGINQQIDMANHRIAQEQALAGGLQVTAGTRRSFREQADETQNRIRLIGLNGPMLAMEADRQKRNDALKKNREEMDAFRAKRKTELDKQVGAIGETYKAPLRESDSFMEVLRVSFGGKPTDWISLWKERNAKVIDARKQADADMKSALEDKKGADEKLKSEFAAQARQNVKAYLEGAVDFARGKAGDLADPLSKMIEHIMPDRLKRFKQGGLLDILGLKKHGSIMDLKKQALDANQDLLDLQSEAAQERLRIGGQEREAEAMAIKRSFDRRIAEARLAGKQELAAELETLRGLKVAAAERAAIGRASTFETGTLYAGGPGGFAGTDGRRRLAARYDAEAAERQARREQILQQKGLMGSAFAPLGGSALNDLTKLFEQVAHNTKQPTIPVAG